MANSPLPKRLREARLAFKISQKQLGIVAGIDEFSASPRINQYETGKHVPDFLTLKRIADVLAIPTAYFYAEENQLAQLIKVFNKLKINERNTLLEQIKSVEIAKNLNKID